jgi:hypothetical protein
MTLTFLISEHSFHTLIENSTLEEYKIDLLSQNSI